MSDFIYNGQHHTATDSAPIGLSLMVVVAEIWMDHTLKEAMKIAERKNISTPRLTCVYMDDTFGILRQNPNKTAHIDFVSCLNEVDPRLKFTFELEEKGELPFLDVLLTHLI